MAASVNSTIQKGIADYQQKDFEQAESSFSKAAGELPDSPKLNYNLGNSQYKTGKYQQALQTYTKAMTADTTPELKEKTLYNTGNVLFRMGKLEEAETAYKKALEMNPKDMDAKFNLEFVREQLKKKNEKQKPNSKDNPNQKKDSSPDDNENDQGNSSNQGNPKSSSENEPDVQLSPADQQETAASNLTQPQNNSISKDQADQWLSVLNEDLKKFRQKQARKERAVSPNQNKDW